MITKKLKHNMRFDDLLCLFQAQYNHAVHYAFNRYSDSKGNLKDSDVENLVKSNMNHIDLLDASFIKQAVSKAKWIYVTSRNPDGSAKKIVFGGKYNFHQRSKKSISKDEFKEKALLPIRCVGSKNDNGNRKFALDLKNHKIVFKKDALHHYEIELNRFSKSDEKVP